MTDDSTQPSCMICLETCFNVDAKNAYHTRCLKTLFGTHECPALAIHVAKLHTFALAMVGKTVMSGVQRKLSLSLDADKLTLQMGLGKTRYILKPQANTYPALPENEHLTMQLAKLAGILVPPCGLVRLQDNTLAYIVKRFDRIDQEKIHQVSGPPWVNLRIEVSMINCSVSRSLR